LVYFRPSVEDGEYLMLLWQLDGARSNLAPLESGIPLIAGRRIGVAFVKRRAAI
jgi:hypothetical protein